MDIEKVTQATKNLEPFPPDKRGFYHTIMSLIISQRIRFSKGRRIRKSIYETLGDSTLDEIMMLTEDQKWDIIKAFDAWYCERIGGSIGGGICMRV